MVCDKDEKEYIYHFVLHCTTYKEERITVDTSNSHNYIESDEDILWYFLFDKVGHWRE